MTSPSILDRLNTALLEVALCETFLSLDESRRADDRAKSAQLAAAHQRALELVGRLDIRRLGQEGKP